MIVSAKINFVSRTVEIAHGSVSTDGLVSIEHVDSISAKDLSNLNNYLLSLESETDYKVVPNSVTMRQARLALLSKGILDTVDSVLVDQSDKISWEYATEVYRNSPIVSKLQTELNLTDEVLDTLFLEASKL